MIGFAGLWVEPRVQADDKPAAKVAEARQAAIAFLRTTQADEGSWTSPTAAGISGLITTALLKAGVEPSDPMLQKALKNLESFIQSDGGIYEKNSGHRNYETSISLLAFQAANDQHQYDKQIANARDFLKKLQWDDTEDVKPDDVRFGGAGYGNSKRPDLSNTAFLLEALKAAGVGPDDQAMKNAVVFVSRCQNLESEHNTTEFASKVNDGGFYYTPAGGGNSQAGATENGGLRSYASMTYAGLKSMIYAGVDAKDPRVQAAYKWLQKHYSLAENPGMGQAGLFYYYHTLAKALDTMQVKTFEEASGKQHDWRAELTSQLLSLQKENGSWVNGEKKWMEGDPNMATAYALLTLAILSPAGK
ncbi:MAG: terpene cyclase/mutase family protein [Planctomycetes bacterium]|nr:terpene cyclase/mutase family protein [Planctomycetota bacterium]